MEVNWRLPRPAPLLRDDLSSAAIDIRSQFLGIRHEALEEARELLSRAATARAMVLRVVQLICDDPVLRHSFGHVCERGGDLSAAMAGVGSAHVPGSQSRTAATTRSHIPGLAVVREDTLDVAKQHYLAALLESLHASDVRELTERQIRECVRAISEMPLTLHRAKRYLANATAFVEQDHWKLFRAYCIASEGSVGADTRDALGQIIKITRRTPAWSKAGPWRLPGHDDARTSSPSDAPLAVR